MGIVNATPDSFSDGGRQVGTSAGLKAVLDHCDQLLREGADILDIGGESTRPGAIPLALDEELVRVLPVVRHAVQLGVPISVDTYKPQVMQAALDLGADIINDIWSLRQPGARHIVARHASCGVCLMHMHKEPLTMQVSPPDGDVLASVKTFLIDQAGALEGLGVDARRIVLDPGIGFGKTVAQNFSLLARQNELLACGYPLLAGWSRKSSLAAVASALPDGAAQMNIADRLAPSLAAALLAVERGARIVRVHDVRHTVQALKVWSAAR